MAIVNDYQTGTVSVANGSTAVTGVGTAWQVDANNPVIRPGDLFGRAGLWVAIASVTDNTHLTLAENWPGTTLSGSAYRIRIQPDGSRYTAAARTLVEMLADGKLASLAGQTGAAGKLPYLTGATTFGLTNLSDFARTLLDDADAGTMLATLGVKAVRQVATFNSVSGPYSTTSTDFVQSESFSLTSANSTTSSLIVLAFLQVECARGGAAGPIGINANLFRYTGSAYQSVGDRTRTSLDTASTENITRIVRGQIPLLSVLPASKRRSDLPFTWTLAPYFSNVYSGNTAKIMDFNAMMIEVEP